MANEQKKEKRFWWLKLKEGYFDSAEMRRLRKAAGGEVFTIIYLKLQLASLKTGGVISFDGYDESFADEIAFTIGEESENVANAIAILRRYKLIEDISESSFFLPDAVANTGSETGAAARMRNLRKRKS